MCIGKERDIESTTNCLHSLQNLNHKNREMNQCNKLWLVLVVMIVSQVKISDGKWGVAGYKNYTVGDDIGWFDKLEKSSVDYQKWASSKTFSLGDFLSMFYPLSLSLSRSFILSSFFGFFSLSRNHLCLSL